MSSEPAPSRSLSSPRVAEIFPREPTYASNVDIFEMSERTYRRAEQTAALVVAGAAPTADAEAGEPSGAGMFGPFAVWFAVVPAAFATGLLVLAVNGSYAARGGVPDRFNAAIGGITVLTTPPMLAPVFYGKAPAGTSPGVRHSLRVRGRAARDTAPCFPECRLDCPMESGLRDGTNPRTRS